MKMTTNLLSSLRFLLGTAETDAAAAPLAEDSHRPGNLVRLEDMTAAAAKRVLENRCYVKK